MHRVYLFSIERTIAGTFFFLNIVLLSSVRAGTIEVYSAGQKYASLDAYQKHRQVVFAAEAAKAAHPAVPAADAAITVAGITIDPSKGKTVSLGPGGEKKEEVGVGRPDLGLAPSDLVYDPAKGKTIDMKGGVSAPDTPAISSADTRSRSPQDLRVAGISPSFRQLVDAFRTDERSLALKAVHSTGEVAEALRQGAESAQGPVLIIADKTKVRILGLRQVLIP